MVKKKWSRPECERVRLVAEEAVITGCKVSGTRGPSSTGQNCKVSGVNCSEQVS